MEEKSEIIALLKLWGFSEDQAKKAFNRWYAWLNFTLAKREIKQHFKAIEELMYDQLIVIKDIDVDLVCPHHLLPVFLNVHIGYLPNGKILGLSKFARVAKDLATPVTQEAYTQSIITVIDENLKPKWCMAIVIGEHSCMRCRGVKAKDSKTITSEISCNKSEVNDATFRNLKDEMMRIVGY